jgi:hypothetical protein
MNASAAPDDPAADGCGLNLVDGSSGRRRDGTDTGTHDCPHRTAHQGTRPSTDRGAGRLLLGGAGAGEQAERGNEYEFLHGSSSVRPLKRDGGSTPA